MSNKAILDGQHNVVPIDDLMEWARWIEDNKYRRRRAEVEGWTLPDEDPTRVGFDRIGATQVSTVFLGLDHGFGGTPLWFETMVFGGDFDGEQRRYSTWDEAVAGHRAIVAEVRSRA